MRPTRRRYLGAVGAASLAGCLGGGEGGARSTPTDGGPTDTATEAQVTRLQALSVAGSPGGRVPVREPGTPSLVDFFATWCAPCKPQMASLGAVRGAYGTDELHVASVTTETDRDAIRDFWLEYDGTWPVLLDPDLAATQSYSVKGVPTLVLLDGAGDVRWRHRGLAGEDTLRREVDEAVEG